MGNVLVNNPDASSNVVDGMARKGASELLRRFIGGQITNDEFEDRAPITEDPAIHAIWDTAWLFYSDLKEHKLKGRDRLHPDIKRGCIRWVLFLDSRLPYEWPPIRLPGNDPSARSVSGLLATIRHLIGLNEKPTRAARFMDAGHYPVWPFISQKDYREALRNPTRLSGPAET